MKKETLGTIYLILIALIWGIAFIAIESALRAGWQTFPLLTVRGFIGGTVALVFSFKSKWYKDKYVYLLGFVCGVFFFLGYAMQTIGQQLSSVSNSAFLTALNVVFVPFILRVFMKKKIPLKVYIASIIAVVGTGILTIDSTFSIHKGDIILIICAICFAAQIVYAEKCKDKSPLGLTAVELYTMGILSLICMPIFKETTFPSEGWLGVLYAAIFSSAIASILQFYGQKYVSSSKASLILVQESVIACIASVLFLHDPLTWRIVVGGILMISAVLIVEVEFKKKNEDDLYGTY